MGWTTAWVAGCMTVLALAPPAASADAQAQAAALMAEARRIDPDLACQSRDLDADFVEAIRAGPADDGPRGSDGHARMMQALDGRYAGGAFVVCALADFGARYMAVLAHDGDRAAQFWLNTVVASGRRAFAERVGALVPVFFDGRTRFDVAAALQTVWSDNTVHLLPYGAGQVQGWGVPPDFLEVVYASRNCRGCGYIRTDVWLARALCP